MRDCLKKTWICTTWKQHSSSFCSENSVMLSKNENKKKLKWCAIRLATLLEHVDLLVSYFKMEISFKTRKVPKLKKKYFHAMFFFRLQSLPSGSFQPRWWMRIIQPTRNIYQHPGVHGLDNRKFKGWRMLSN